MNKHHNSFLLMLLSLVGVSCESILNQSDAYGCPYADYSIKGRLVDFQGNPVKGLKVTPLGPYSPYPVAESDFTSADGSYSFSFKGVHPRPSRLAIEDVDGEENGGMFKTDTINIKKLF